MNVFRQAIGFVPYMGISPHQRLDTRTSKQQCADKDAEMRSLLRVTELAQQH
jgi:hypothetical protein